METKQKIDELNQDGFTFFRQFVSASEAERARQEIETWYQKDLTERQQQNITDPHHKNGVAWHTVLTDPSHLMIDVYGKSPALDGIVEKILTSPNTKTILQKWIGSEFNLYGYNIRRMTGKHNPAPAHELHRDSLGEFGIGILLTDLDPFTDAATTLIKGSHHYPYDPRWNTLLDVGQPLLSSKLNKIAKYRIFNRALAKKIKPLHYDASGKQGDVYFFINDLWHGREPNLNGKEGMVVLIGGAASHIKLHHKFNPPPKELLDTVPPTLKACYTNRDKPEHPEEETIINELIKSKRRLKKTSLFYWAKKEKEILDKL